VLFDCANESAENSDNAPSSASVLISDLVFTLIRTPSGVLLLTYRFELDEPSDGKIALNPTREVDWNQREGKRLFRETTKQTADFSKIACQSSPGETLLQLGSLSALHRFVVV
jgi:hypothetical protein